MPTPSQPARSAAPLSGPATLGPSSAHAPMPSPPDDDEYASMQITLNDGELLLDGTEPIENETAPTSDFRKHWH